MIEKYCHLPAAYPDGTPRVHRIIPGASERTKLAYPLLPKISYQIDQLKPDPDKIFLLINAMGASEFYGQNSNGDIWPEKSLSYGGDYGYRTFLNACLFAHHKNSDPSLAIGKILASEWNDHMKRVELIVALYRSLAARHGCQYIVSRLDRGEYPDGSMGARVLFDGCSRCLDWDKYEAAKATYDPRIHKQVDHAILAFHKKDPITGLAPTSENYCDHIRNMKNKIMPNGLQVGMINFFPRFFDYSMVFVGADRTSKTMINLSKQMPEAESETSYFFFDQPKPAPAVEGAEKEQAVKTAALDLQSWGASTNSPFVKAALLGGAPVDKTADVEKQSDIVKRVTSTFESSLLPRLEERERDLTDDELRNISNAGLDRGLSTLTGMGVILKPREYDRLISICHEDPVEHARRLLVPQTDKIRLAPHLFSQNLAEMLSGVMRDRSFHAPILVKRVVVAVSSPRSDDQVSVESDKKDNSDSGFQAFLDKKAESYQDYRSQILTGSYPIFEEALKVPTLKQQLPGDVSRPGAIPVIYMVNAHRDEKTEEDDGLVEFIKDHPWLTAAVVIPGLLKLKAKFAK